MVSSGGPSGCLPNASARVSINSFGPVEVMTVVATGLPANTNFDLFNIQVPKFPFGLSWYLGDMQNDGTGKATGTFVGRFQPRAVHRRPRGRVGAPHRCGGATTNPPTGPVHIFHLGLWFNRPDDAVAAGCENFVTPFNGEHNVGVQVLNTSNASETAAVRSPVSFRKADQFSSPSRGAAFGLPLLREPPQVPVRALWEQRLLGQSRRLG